MSELWVVFIHRVKEIYWRAVLCRSAIVQFTVNLFSVTTVMKSFRVLWPLKNALKPTLAYCRFVLRFRATSTEAFFFFRMSATHNLHCIHYTDIKTWFKLCLLIPTVRIRLRIWSLPSWRGSLLNVVRWQTSLLRHCFPPSSNFCKYLQIKVSDTVVTADSLISQDTLHFLPSVTL